MSPTMSKDTVALTLDSRLADFPPGLAKEHELLRAEGLSPGKLAFMVLAAAPILRRVGDDQMTLRELINDVKTRLNETEARP